MDHTLKAWEDFKPELLNQKVCRLLLSVHRKSSRLGVLGELGRQPLLVRALAHTLKYEWNLSNKVPPDALVSLALTEMKSMADNNHDCWFTRILKFKKNLKIPNYPSRMKKENVGKKILKTIESKFSLFWKDEINKEKIGSDNLCHNKLRFYKKIKSSFTLEPYI